MTQEQMVIVVVLVAAGILCVYGICKNPKCILDFCIRAIVGVLCIHFINIAIVGLGYTTCVGINEGTICITGLLGLPGVVLLYGMGSILT